MTFHLELREHWAGGLLRGHKLSAQGHTARGVRCRNTHSLSQRSLQLQGSQVSELKGPLTISNACTHFTDRMAGVSGVSQVPQPSSGTTGA